MAFALESGENRLGAGAAGAWMRLALTDRSDFAEALKKITPRMSGIQQDSLAAALANSLAASRESGGSDAGKEETDIWRINLAVSEWAWSPGKETLQTELSRRSTALSGVRSGAGMIPDAFPEHAILLATMLEKRLQEQPDQVLEQLSAMDESTPNPELRPAVFNRAAPHILPQLCRTGHVAEAVQLLDKVHDSGAWRQSFQAMLPYWMDVDPAAARAAFDAAPLTALERERWQQHPVFLLHP